MYPSGQCLDVADQVSGVPYPARLHILREAGLHEVAVATHHEPGADRHRAARV